MLWIGVTQAVVCGIAAWPIVYAWIWLAPLLPASPMLQALVVGLAVVPSYAAFALALMGTSAAACRVSRLRTPADRQFRIADVDWPLMRWAHYMVAIHLVRMLAGPLFRGSPIWTAYLRSKGARIGRRVYVNSLSLSDYNLLDFGDDVVIGSDVHLSGHTVEGGMLKTGGIRLEHGVTIGLGSVVDIGVTIGARAQIGAMSLVRKHTSVPADSTWVGIPIRRVMLERPPEECSHG